jgi:acyl-coenzyme A thioesterase PaaI-like protein
MTGIMPRTHLETSASLVGEPVETAAGVAVARLVTTEAMRTDSRGLVHGGFTFGLADYAAMLAVNDPHVVLGAAECRFLAPVRVGERLTARAEVREEKGRKRVVACVVEAGGKSVFEGTFTCFALERHILDG